jgi:hypothetical protein
MIIVFFVIALGIMVLAFVLYKILLEETSNISKDKILEKEEKEKIINSTYMSKINKNGIDNVINSIKDNPDEIDKFKAEIQKEVRKALKAKNMTETRKLQGYLKKIDNI